jgi:hypothetical protein
MVRFQARARETFPFWRIQTGSMPHSTAFTMVTEDSCGRGYNGHIVTVTMHLRLVPWLRISKAVISLSNMPSWHEQRYLSLHFYYTAWASLSNWWFLTIHGINVTLNYSFIIRLSPTLPSAESIMYALSIPNLWDSFSWLQTFALFWMPYAVFWVIPRHL